LGFHMCVSLSCMRHTVCSGRQVSIIVKTFVVAVTLSDGE
jgi:hypothetical protein